MDSFFAWLHGARWRMSLSHCLEALLIQVPVAFLAEFLGVVKTQSWWIGFAAVVAWFWSREKAQYEERIKVPGESNTSVWNKGYFPGEWGGESVLDLVFPVISSAAIAFGLSYWVMHRL